MENTKSEKKRVLIFPAGTEIAFELYDALRFSKFVDLYGGNSVPSHADFVFEKCIDGIPFARDENFVDSLNEVIEKYKIDYIYPAHDSALLTLTEEQSLIKAKVVTSDLKTVEICRSKRKTYEFFKNESFIPQVFENPKEIKSFPVFAKPAIGQGSIGTVCVREQRELDILKDDGKDYVYAEYLPGEEFTVDCFTDRHRELRAVKMRTRERIRAGISVRSRLVNLPQDVKNMAEKINSSLSFNGAWFFQIKQDANGKYKLLEIAPRIPGTMRVSRNLGINFPLLTLYNMWGYDVDIIDNENEILMDRAFIARFKTNVNYSSVYIDLDDTLIVDNKVNIKLLGFLYQAIAKRKKLYLLTRHEGDITGYLRQNKIAAELFDEIIFAPKDVEKSEFVAETEAIFIDDSFAERKKMKTAKNIPVFDLDMVESLIEREV